MKGEKAFLAWLEEHKMERMSQDPRQIYIEQFLHTGGQERLCRYCCQIKNLDYEEIKRKESESKTIDCEYMDYDLILSLDIF